MARRRIPKKPEPADTQAKPTPSKKRKVRKRKVTSKRKPTTKKPAPKAEARSQATASTDDPYELARYYDRRPIGELLRIINDSPGKVIDAYTGELFNVRSETQAQRKKLIKLQVTKDTERWKLTDLGRQTARALRARDRARAEGTL